MEKNILEFEKYKDFCKFFGLRPCDYESLVIYKNWKEVKEVEGLL